MEKAVQVLEDFEHIEHENKNKSNQKCAWCASERKNSPGILAGTPVSSRLYCEKRPLLQEKIISKLLISRQPHTNSAYLIVKPVKRNPSQLLK